MAGPSSPRPFDDQQSPSPGPERSANQSPNPFIFTTSPRPSTSSEQSKVPSAPNNVHRGSTVHWPDEDATPMSAQNGTNEKESKLDEDEADAKRIPLKERIRHFTWTWFTMTMATGGIANVIHTGVWPFEEYTTHCWPG